MLKWQGKDSGSVFTLCKCCFGFSLEHFICQSLGTLSRVNWTSSLQDGDENTYNAYSVLMPFSTLENFLTTCVLLREHINKQRLWYSASALCKIQKGQSILAQANPPKSKESCFEGWTERWRRRLIRTKIEQDWTKGQSLLGELLVVLNSFPLSVCEFPSRLKEFLPCLKKSF